MSATDVVVVGAGPNGVSVAAHLAHLGIEHRLFGRPISLWRDHMPAGMYLRSEPYASDIKAPVSGYRVSDYCAMYGVNYVDRVQPISIETFVDYSLWLTKQLADHAEPETVTEVRRDGREFVVTTAEGESSRCNRVVMATGLAQYRRLPAEIQHLPKELVSHSTDHRDLSVFAGRRVAVIGGGQAALETAALLHEGGASVRLLVRAGAVHWLPPNPDRITGLRRLTRPVNPMCEGFHCAAYNMPDVWRMVPERLRLDKIKTILGPAGAWWLEQRVAGVIPVHVKTRVLSSEARGGRAVLHLDSPDFSSLEVDHVLACTGFDVDLRSMSSLHPALLAEVDLVGKTPRLSRNFESSVPGLYFPGIVAAPALGPSMRFLSGTHHAGPRISGSIARQRRQRTTSPTPVLPQQRPAEDIVAEPDPV